MLDLSVIILTYNEELHIRRALENVCSMAKKVYVVDCISQDKTQEICHEYNNVEVVEHKWPGNQAEQFNWALDNLTIDTKWVLRLDADEYLTEALKEEMQQKLPTMPDDVSAAVLPLGRAFHGKVLKHGIVKGIKMIRLFRKGKVRYEQRLMDEHLQVLSGDTVEFDNQFVDDSLISMAAFTAKHNDYSNREAALLLDAEYELSEQMDGDDGQYAPEVTAKRKQKAKYAKMPLYWRSIGYFIYRYIVKLGFLDGRAGFEWDFFQGLWYRMLIDAKIAEAKRMCGRDKEKMRDYIEKNWNIKLQPPESLREMNS